MSKRFVQILAVVFASLQLSSCVVTYRQFPMAKVGAPAPTKAYTKLYYHVDGLGLAGGHLAIERALKYKSPFKETEVAEQPPAQGLFVDAKIKNIPPSIPSVIFGFLSYTTLTITPAWTTRAGSDLWYEVYVDGKKIKTFDYEVRRKGFVWIVLLPFIWSNLLTYSEEQAFDASTLQFFDDADSLFRTAASSAP